MALARVRDQSAPTIAAMRAVAAGYVAAAAGWLLVHRGGSPVVLVGLVVAGALVGAGTSWVRSGVAPLAWRAPAVGLGAVAMAMLSASAGLISLAASGVLAASVAFAVATVRRESGVQTDA